MTAGGGPYYRAMYDYTAADTDEVRDDCAWTKPYTELKITGPRKGQESIDVSKVA